MIDRYSYPRTPHLPWSQGVTSDDIIIGRDKLIFSSVVVTEKMDGENITIYSDGHVHARSLENPGKLASYAKLTAANLIGRIAPGHRICGELMTYYHSVNYRFLPSQFLVHSIWRDHLCLGWDETQGIASDLGLQVVREIWRGPYSEKTIRSLDWSSPYTDEPEGYVVRYIGSFTLDTFADNVAKFVRRNHVPEDRQHWTKRPRKNDRIWQKN